MKKKSLVIMLISCFILLGNITANSQIIVKIKPHKPKKNIVQPARPNAGHIWIDGHWLWSKKDNKYVWIKGHWAKPPIVGATWISGYWMDSPEGYKWVPGYWKSPKFVHPKKPIKGHRK